ncbi:serine/threonine protein kinase [Filimonas zeae]|uniref:Protein kinase domain-containing protein n=1 Tax=Filimonas zeae TaxID=1737353 RepID=A0A917MWW5_9BACT|nr:lanthionine synthetase LanC family protein [Filimonas zeae]MDR6338983.1 serine/threonine protein kinase [Filimonas zeae]GGH65668.1 hypothetical protein GCM10011379_19040 [Filimonas zeae]
MITVQDIEMPAAYREWLVQKHMPFADKGIYIQVGELPAITGWMLELSVIALQLDSFMNKMLPFIADERVTFILPVEKEAAEVLIRAGAGYAQAARIIVLYSVRQQEIAALAEKLISLTEEFRSPQIPGTCWLGGCVYVRYGPFRVMQESAEAFSVPKNVSWPFGVRRPSSNSSGKKTLNNTYRITELIKHNPKGDAMKAIYYKGFFRVGKCFIKQGRINTFMDPVGRDVRDRLKWQYQLHQELEDMKGLPKALDLFEEDRDCYLVTELINGYPFTQMVHGAMLFNTWAGVPDRSRQQILGVLLQIVRLVGEMHARGYLHRDIAPENFLIVNDQVFMIDLELAWNKRTGQPSPAFILGSQGYMSPSQEAALIPVEEDDIYALGALMVFTFCSYQPARVNENLIEMQQRLHYFTGSSALADLVIACLQPLAEKRPRLSEIEGGIIGYSNLLLAGNIWEANSVEVNGLQLRNCVQRCLNAINSPLMASEEGIWWSLPRQNRLRQELLVQRVRTVYPAFIDGISGVLWVLAVAEKAGLAAGERTRYQTNLEVLKTKFLYAGNTGHGLYEGLAGLGVALSAGIKAGFILDDATARRDILHCLQQDVTGVDVAVGVSGHGLAVLCCLSHLDPDKAQELLESDIKYLLQEASHWKGKGIGAGFSNGLAGVLYFFWTYLHWFEHAEVRKCAISGMERLQKLHRQGIEKDLWLEGCTGWIKTYLRAFQITGDPEYRRMAESLLDRIPLTIGSNSYGYLQGVWGLGDVMVEAVKVLKRENDKKRVESLVGRTAWLLFNDTESEAYWVLQTGDAPVAGGVSDNAGGLFFLLRVLYPDSVSALFDPL